MSKLDNSIINNIRTLSIDMINESRSGNKELQINAASIFYYLYLNHYNYNIKDNNWVNEDKLVVSNSLLPVYYSSRFIFGLDKNIDNLKEFRKLNSNTLGYKYSMDIPGDVLSLGTGISLGERYLESIISKENSKCDLVNYHTYVVCTFKEIESGLSLEALKYIIDNKLNKLVTIVIEDKNSSNESLYRYLKELGYNVIEISNSEVDDAIDEAKNSKKPSIILVQSLKKELSEEEIRNKYNIDAPFYVNEEKVKELKSLINKRINKMIIKWNELLDLNISNVRIKKVLDFIKNKNIDIGFNIDNLKIDDNYEEELIKGNSKIFNVIANKSEFILNCSDDFNTTLVKINNSKLMDIDNPLNRNILFNSVNLMSSISLGLAYLGFKVFVSTSLVNSSSIIPFIKFSVLNKFNIHYIFTQDTFLYPNHDITPSFEINNLRLIPHLINFRPADINEVIGTYSIVTSLNTPSSIVISSEKMPKLMGTNPKYVLGGAYRVKREKGEANGVIIASGSEVAIAIKLADQLFPYGIDLRVVTMPSMELFDHQNDRYKSMLLPRELKIFSLEYGTKNLWNKYVTNSDYIFGLDDYPSTGTKNELLNNYNLDMDSLMTKIIETFKK